jgi:Outer membrane lipoprotein-sorting protein
MLRFDRSSVLLFYILLSLSVLYGCTRSTGGSTATQPSPAPSPKLPEVSSMIKRITTQDGCRDFAAVIVMTSFDRNNGGNGGNRGNRGNKVSKRDHVEFKIQRKYSADRVSTFLSVLAPHEEIDKALLAIEQPNQATQAFSYLPGLKKLSKLNSEKQISFRGAKVTVQELLGMELDQYTHSTGVREMKGEEPLIKVEFKEKPYFGLAFPRIVGYFRERDEQPLSFELYDLRDELQKRVEIEEVKMIQNRRTITKAVIDDLGQKLRLRLETMKIEYDRGLPDSIFTEKYLINFISNAGRRLDQDR